MVGFIFSMVIQTLIFVPSPHLFIQMSLNGENMESSVEHLWKTVDLGMLS